MRMRSLSFRVRPSRLDVFESTSYLRQSQLRGFAVLAGFLSLAYPWIKVIKNIYSGKEPISTELADAMFNDTCLLMIWWCKLGAWAYTAYFNIKLYASGRIPLVATRLFQYTSQLVLLAHAVFGCLFRDWPIIPSCFILVVGTVCFMKMHAFSDTNIRFVEEKQVEQLKSINLPHFTRFLWAPVLVYEPSYPRGPGFRWWYLLAKSLSLISAMTILYVLITDHILPTTFLCVHIPVVEFYARLLFPYIFAGLLTFYILFECVCNMFAEITNFGDREFYRDWWNSTNFEEFNRLWNRPVHEFLLRHVYFESLRRLHVTKMTAIVLTFSFSAVMHEAILAVCLRRIRVYMMCFMATQIPLICIGRFYKGSIVGNMAYWASITYGLPSIGWCYGREWAPREHARLGIDPITLSPAEMDLGPGAAYPSIRLF